MRSSLKLVSIIAGILILAACNLPTGQPATQGPSVNELAATIVAATLKAAATSTPPITPFASPMPLATTPAGKATLFINVDNAACRSGPGPDFKEIAKFPAGTTVDLAGQDTADSYWIVTDPTSHDLCWVSVQDATPAGNFQALPQVTPPAASVSVPAKPSRGSWNFSCDNSSLTIILGWNAPSGPVNGYRIYRKGSQIADVPSDQTKFTETIPFTYGSSMTYAVAAYNDAGVSPEATWNFHCP